PQFEPAEAGHSPRSDSISPHQRLVTIAKLTICQTKHRAVGLRVESVFGVGSSLRYAIASEEAESGKGRGIRTRKQVEGRIERVNKVNMEVIEVVLAVCGE